MQIRYEVFDPTKNITLLVTTPVPRALHARVARELLRRRPEAEQVGFLEAPSSPAARLRLQMMGGEFCGNASLSAGAFLAKSDGLPAGETADYRLEASGMDGLLSCRVEHLGDGFRGTVAMPLPERIGTAQLPMDGGLFLCPAVFLPGMIHCIVPAGLLTRPQAEELIRPLCKKLSAAACGLLLFDEAAESFAPLVFVASTETAVWESGCGSGSAAIGAYLAHRAKAVRTVSLRQPGGVIQVRADWDGSAVSALSITSGISHLGGFTEELPDGG